MAATHSKIARLKGLLLENREVGQTITKNTFWLSFGEIMGRILRLFVIIYAARVLGAAGWGVFSYLTSLAAILTIFSDIGLSSVVIREGAREPRLRDRYFSTAFLFKIVLALLGFLLIILFSRYLTNLPVSLTLTYFVGLLFVFDSLRRFSAALFRAEERMEREALVNIITQAVIVAAGFAALFIVASPESLALAYAVGAGVGLVTAGYMLRSYLQRLISSFDKKLLKPILVAAWPLSLAAIFGVLIVNIDTVILGWFREAAEVGYYAAAQKPIAFLYLLPTLITSGFFPTLARLVNKNNEEFRQVFEKGLSLVFLLAVPLTIGIVLTADQIVNLFYGAEYEPAAGPLRILALTLLTVFPVGMIVNAVFAYNRQNELVPLWSAGLLLNIALSLLLIPPLGIVGAAWAGFFTQVIINTLIWRRMKKINDFSIWGELKPILLATFMMGVVVILARQLGLHFLLILPLAIAAFFGSLLWSGEKAVVRLRDILKRE